MYVYLEIMKFTQYLIVLLAMRRLAVHSFTLIGSILYFLQTSGAPNIPLGELPSSLPGLADFDLSARKESIVNFILSKIKDIFFPTNNGR